MQKYLRVSKSAVTVLFFPSSIFEYGTSGFKDTAEQEN